MSQSDDSRDTGPDQLDPNALPPHVYHRTVGPALQVAAETAAKRGHKYLFDDLPTMLALVEMVTRLTDLYLSYYPEAPEGYRPLLDNAATAACVMVFQEAKLDPQTIDHLLSALEGAYRRVHEQSVIEGAERYIAMGFSHLDDEDRDQARHCLTQGCEHVIAAVELWQKQAGQ